MIYVDNVPLTIDVAEWMRQTGRFAKIKPATGREWIEATCPYHDETHPSFAVNIETGRFRCQACGAHGNFVQLVKHVEQHDTIFDAEQSLLARYGRFVPDTDEELTLDFGDGEEEAYVKTELLDRFVRYPRYLEHRGIWETTQDVFGVRYSEIDRAVAFPWYDERGRCVTVKYRSVEDKRFWYDPPVATGRLARLLYGFHLAKDADLIVVTEAEIDTMSVYQAGFASVALGGANFSETQANLLRNAKADEIVVFTDNDEAGRRVRGKIIDALIGYKRVSVVDWSINTEEAWNIATGQKVYDRIVPLKDANEVLRWGGTAAVAGMIEKRVPVSLPLRID